MIRLLLLSFLLIAPELFAASQPVRERDIKDMTRRFERYIANSDISSLKKLFAENASVVVNKVNAHGVGRDQITVEIFGQRLQRSCPEKGKCSVSHKIDSVIISPDRDSIRGKLTTKEIINGIERKSRRNVLMERQGKKLLITKLSIFY